MRVITDAFEEGTKTGRHPDMTDAALVEFLASYEAAINVVHVSRPVGQ